MVVTFLYACRLKPGVKNEWNPIFDPGFTDDKMAVVFELPKDKSIEEVATVLKNHGAHEVLSKTLEDAQ